MTLSQSDTMADRLPDGETLLVALLAGAGGVAGSFAVAGFTPSFVVGPIAGFLARELPAALITFSIVVLGDLGEQLNVVMATGLAALLLGAIAIASRTIGRRINSPTIGRGLAIIAAGGAAFGITGAPLASGAAGLATGLVLSIATLGGEVVPAPNLSPARRRVLAGTAAAMAFVVGGYAVGANRGVGRPTATESNGLEFDATTRSDIEAKLGEASAKSLDVEGLEPLVSDQFYQVDINATDPDLDASTWTLRVTGAVERELTYTYDDLLDREPRNQFISLRCVGESLNGRKMDNALWTGIPIMDLVEPAGVNPGCCVMLRAADGFFEEFPLEALQDGFLAYGMNGDVLPRGHGYPARALIPGHWGEINVKWLTDIEVLETEQDGYWERRGWHGTGPVNTVAKLHVINHLDDGRIEVAGHAYAGTRGIQSVEVSTDGGGSWTEAVLSAPLPGTDVWRQWVHRYDAPAGAHDVVVRAIDGTGTLQPSESASAFPSGPSGWVSRTVRP